MYRRDYFLKMTQELAIILAKVLGLKETGEVQKASDVIHDAYQELLGLNRKHILQINNSTMIDQLKEEVKLKNEQLEVLARLLFEDAELASGDYKYDLYNKSLLILEHLNVVQKMYSFEREEFIDRIKERL